MKIRYYSFNKFLKNKFPGKKIRKIPVNAGFGCPNKDGTLSFDGCIFCDQYGSGPIKKFNLPVRDQIRSFIDSHPDNYYIAYYQAHSNTSGNPDDLIKKYRIALEYDRVLGLFVGTRPDAINDAVYPVLAEINSETYFSVELGLQSIHEKSLNYLKRNHTYDQFLRTYFKLKKKNIDVIVHLILGIPQETFDDMKKTILEMNRIKPAGIKIHMLHVIRNTHLYEMYERGEVNLFNRSEYVETLVTLLEFIDPEIVIHRLTGERDREIFHAPEWALDKPAVLSAINRLLEEKNSYQGKNIRLNGN